MSKIDLKEIEDYLEDCAISDNFLYPQYQIALLIQEYKNLHSIIKEVRELLKNDYFEDGSFTNYDKVFELLDKEEIK